MKKVVDPINYYIWYHISYVVCYKVGSHKRLLNGCQVISWSFLNQDVAQGTQKPTPQKGQTKCRGSVKLRHDVINNQPKRKKESLVRATVLIYSHKKKKTVYVVCEIRGLFQCTVNGITIGEKPVNSNQASMQPRGTRVGGLGVSNARSFPLIRLLIPILE